MRVDHRSLDTAMTQKQLDCPDVSACGKQMRGEAVPQTVDTRVLVNLCFCNGLFERALYR